jgi:hypothetical protein
VKKSPLEKSMGLSRAKRKISEASIGFHQGLVK